MKKALLHVLQLAALVMVVVAFGSPLRAESSFAWSESEARMAAIVCGDADGSGTVDLADVTFTTNYLYSGGPTPDPEGTGDQNCDGVVNISDCTYLISYLFDLGGPKPCCPCGNNCLPRPYTADFDLETATQMADLAHWAYFEASDFDSGNCIANCWTAITFIESDPDFDCDVIVTGHEDTQLFLARDRWSDDIVVSFRGSGTLQDWISDAQFVNPADWRFEGGVTVPNSVHKGFLCAYQSIKAELESELSQAIEEVDDFATARVYFTGHSLGAALATLAALDLSSQLVETYGYDRDNIVMYAFGSPRPFKDALQSHFRQRVPNGHVVIEKTDPVPYLLSSYTHINNMVEINSKLKSDGTPEKTRLEYINGEYLTDCGPETKRVPGSYGQSGHDHRYYRDRLKVVDPYSVPNPSLGVNNGYLELKWSGGVLGPCDRVVLCEDCPATFTNAELLLRPWEWVVKGSPSKTIIPKREGMQAAYIDDYGRVINTSAPFVAKTPSKLTITRKPLGAVVVAWSVSDEGLYDYVALFKQNPSTVGANGYILGTKHMVLNDLNDEWVSTRVGGPYWVAYVTSDKQVGGNRRILRSAGPIYGN